MKKLIQISAVLTLSLLFVQQVFADAPGTANGASCSLGNGTNGQMYNGTCVPSGAYPSASFGAHGLYDVGTLIINLINDVLVPVIFAIAFVVFLWGVYKSYIASGGEPAEREKGHQLILWGLIGFFVMLSVWGLVNIVTGTLGLTGVTAPPLPSSQSAQ